jgi:hypothetical protein
MEIEKEDLDYLVRWILLDETTRPPAKRQRADLEGFWMSRTNPRMRGSDLRERRFICMEALIEIGQLTPSRAAAKVKKELKQGTVAAIRVGYYKSKESKRSGFASLAEWVSHFLRWQDWLLCSDEDSIEFAISKYQKHKTMFAGRARRFAQLMRAIRNDPKQKARNCALREAPALAIGSQLKELDPKLELPSYANSLVVMAKLYRRMGRFDKTIEILQRCSELWHLYGDRWPALKSTTLSQLDRDITALQRAKDHDARGMLPLAGAAPHASDEYLNWPFRSND